MVRKLLGKDTATGYRRRWQDNIKMDRKVIGYEGIDWIQPMHCQSYEHCNELVS
jgi:hypothetical protein